MKRLFLVCCAMFAGLVGLTNCTKNEVVTPDVESVDFTANIEDIDTKTALNGLKVNWEKNDEIGIQVSRNHTENASLTKATYPSTYGVYLREFRNQVSYHSCQCNDAFCRLHLRYV